MMAKDSKLWQMMAKHGKHSITITINKTITIIEESIYGHRSALGGSCNKFVIEAY